MKNTIRATMMVTSIVAPTTDSDISSQIYDSFTHKAMVDQTCETKEPFPYTLTRDGEKGILQYKKTTIILHEDGKIEWGNHIYQLTRTNKSHTSLDIKNLAQDPDNGNLHITIGLYFFRKKAYIPREKLLKVIEDIVAGKPIVDLGDDGAILCLVE